MKAYSTRTNKFAITYARLDTGEARNLEMPMGSDKDSPKKSQFSPAKGPEKRQPSKTKLKQ